MDNNKIQHYINNTTSMPSASAGITITEGTSTSSSGFVDINGDGLQNFLQQKRIRLCKYDFQAK